MLELSLKRTREKDLGAGVGTADGVREVEADIADDLGVETDVVHMNDANPDPGPGRDQSDPGRGRDGGDLAVGTGGGAEVEREKGRKVRVGTELRRMSSPPLPGTGSATGLRPL